MDYNEYVTGSGFNLGDLKANPSLGYFISLGKKAKSQFAEPDAFDRIVNLVSKNWFSPFDDQIFKTLNNKVFAAIGGYIFLKLLYDRLYTIQNFQKSSKGVAHIRRNIRKTTLLLKRTGLWAFLPKNGIYNQAIPDKKKVVVPTNTMVEKLGLKRSSPDDGITVTVETSANKRSRIDIATNTQTTRVNIDQPEINKTTTSLDAFGRPIGYKPAIQPLMSGYTPTDLIVQVQNPAQQNLQKLENEIKNLIVTIPGFVVSPYLAGSLVQSIMDAIKPVIRAMQRHLSTEKLLRLLQHNLNLVIPKTLTAAGGSSEQANTVKNELIERVTAIVSAYILQHADLPQTKTVQQNPRKISVDSGPVYEEGVNPKSHVQSTLRSRTAVPSTPDQGPENQIHHEDHAEEVNTIRVKTEPDISVKVEQPNPNGEAPEEEAEDQVEQEVNQEGEDKNVETKPPKTWDDFLNKYFRKTGPKKENLTFTDNPAEYSKSTKNETDGWWLQVVNFNGTPISPKFPIKKPGRFITFAMDEPDRIEKAKQDMAKEFSTGEGTITGGAAPITSSESYNIGGYLGYLGKMASKVDYYYSLCDPAKQQIFRELAENRPVMLGAVLEQKNSPTTALTITTLPPIGTTRLTIKTPSTGFTVTPMS